MRTYYIVGYVISFQFLKFLEFSGDKTQLVAI
jgi:hypothetical protein